jgi:hypothetical protein
MGLWTILASVVLISVVWKIAPRSARAWNDASRDDLRALPYRKRDSLLSGAERALYETLVHVAGERYRVLAKVRMADVLWIPKLSVLRWTHWTRIAQKHLDFVVCDRRGLEPLLVVELESSSTRPGHAEERSEFVAAALGAASLPLLRLPLKRSYSPQDIAEMVRRRIAAAEPAAQPRAVPPATNDPALPAEEWVWGAPQPAVRPLPRTHTSD